MSKKLTTHDFIQKSTEVHGEKYDYKLVDYINAHVKVKISCCIHGIFELTPNKHVSRKRGCPICGVINRRKPLVFVKSKHKYPRKKAKSHFTTNFFIERANVVHGFKFDYSKVDYINSLKKVDIICLDHGVFSQYPSNHLSGQSCPKCSKDRIASLYTSNISDFISKANLIHNNTYDYALSVYTKSWVKLKIICSKHGVFEQKASKHLCGDGCPKCGNESISMKASLNPTGWSTSNWIDSAVNSKNFDSYKIYIIKCWNDEELFYKIGRTFLKVSQRFSRKASMPYKYEILFSFSLGAKEIVKLESELKMINKNNKYIPKIFFNGMHECFNKIKDYEKFFTEWQGSCLQMGYDSR